jgi:hypothetical protein
MRDTAAVVHPQLGNPVDRFVWNGASLTFERNLIKLHAFQNDGAPTPPGQGDESQPLRGNHNAGVIRFGPPQRHKPRSGFSGLGVVDIASRLLATTEGHAVLTVVPSESYTRARAKGECCDLQRDS